MNVLIVHTGWQLIWSKMWASNLKAAGHEPYYLSPIKPKEDIKYLVDGTKVYNYFIYPLPNFGPFDEILDQNDIDIVLFLGCFTYQDRSLYNFLQTRNFLIKKHELNKKLIDILVSEVGFIRDINYQLDTVGSCCNCSYVYGGKRTTAKPLEDTKKQQWNEFVERFKKRKFKDIKEYTRKDICSILKIPPHKKIIFCPLQIPRDSLLLFQTRWCHGMAEYLQACCYLFDDKDKFHIIFKQHPAYKLISNDQFLNWAIDRLNEENVIFLEADHEINTASFLLYSDTTVTVNSSAGMEALIFDKPVISLGFNAWTPAAIWWNDVGQKSQYNEAIAQFCKKDVKEQRISYLYSLMFNESITFHDDNFDFREIIEFANKKLVHHKL